MPTRKKFLVFHLDPNTSWDKVEENWAKSANVQTATWIRTYYNKSLKIRYCLWLAESEERLKEIFKQLGVTYQSLTEVEETLPDLWGKKWQAHLAADAKAATLGF